MILGHNFDDVSENIISNLSKQIHYENLYGMQSVTMESNVKLLRPFLEVPKEDIIKYADMNSIPHLVDSTPPWSDRGKMRDSLLPKIHMFDSRIIPGLHQFAQYTQFLHKQWEQFFEMWISELNLEQSYASDEGFHIPRNSFFENNYEQSHFWIKLWFHLNFPHRPSNRCFHNLICRIKEYTNKPIKISIIKNIVCVISKDELVFKTYNNF